jgi:L-malate glycosyltransferase
MRFLFLLGSLVHGGAERQTIALINRLQQRGHACHVLHVKDDISQRERIHRSVEVGCLSAKRYFDLGAISRLRKAAITIRPDVVFACNQYALAYASLAIPRMPTVASLHCTKLVSVKEHLQMLAYRPMFWSLNALVFVSQKQRSHWLRRGVFGRRNEVVPNGIDLEHWRASQAAPVHRRALGFADSDYVMGLCAVLRPEKNAALLVEAVGALRRRGVPARGLLIGDGPERDAIDALARRGGISAHVVISGYQMDVRPLLAACDVMAVPSRTEALALAAIESMAMAKPVVHADVGGARELITHGEDGYIFPAASPAHFVDALLRISDPVVRRRMGANARRKVETSFTEDVMVDRYETLLNRIGSSQPGGPIIATDPSL